MTKKARIDEILNQITAFSKESYTKAEYLPELLKLQQEIVNLTFCDDKADKANLKLWDVENHFQNLNDEKGGIADSDLDKFIRESAVVKNVIRAEISGNRGESIVFNALDKLNCYNAVLRNVELEFDGKRTEIDAIVFTHRAIFIIEIKNTKKNIFIDEYGDFFRCGYSMHYDCNIADKMMDREEMLRKALKNTGLEYLKIFNIVTFTNPRIDVENKYHRLKVCGSNYLTTLIEKFNSNCWYSEEEVGMMLTAVEDTMCKEPYKSFVGFESFKCSFANLMAALESVDESEVKEVEDPVKAVQPIIRSVKQNGFPNKNTKAALSIGKFIAAAVVGAIGLHVFMTKLI